MSTYNVHKNITDTIDNSKLNSITSVEDFPALGSKQVKKVNDTPRRMKRHHKHGKRFIIASSRIDEIRRENRQRYNQRQKDNIISCEQKIRDTAFVKLENKDEMAKSLKSTKACRHVTVPKSKTGKYGVCYREVCTFAHSLEEYQDPVCQFGSGCRHINGRIDRWTGFIDKKRKCGFKHPNEDRESYFSRTGKEMPDLPPTSEHTRKKHNHSNNKPREQSTFRKDVMYRPAKQQEKRAQPFIHQSIVNKLNTPPPIAPLEDSANKDCNIIRVPEDMFKQAMEMCVRQGLTNYEIKTY